MTTSNTTPTPLNELIEAWDHEATLAEQLHRVDDYGAQCRETVAALRELAELRARCRDGEQLTVVYPRV